MNKLLRIPLLLFMLLSVPPSAVIARSDEPPPKPNRVLIVGNSHTKRFDVSLGDAGLKDLDEATRRKLQFIAWSTVSEGKKDEKNKEPN